MKNVFPTVGALCGLVVGLAACNGGSSSTPPFNTGQAAPTPSPSPAPGTTIAPGSGQRYIQVDRLSRPLTKEFWERFVDHQQSIVVEPYNDPVLAQSIKTFTNISRDPAYGTAIASMLIPDETAADLSNTVDKASFLALETNGFTGGRFGGRDLADDVVSLSFSTVFGDTLNKIGLVAQDDGKENNCLRSQNTAQRPSQANTGSFPYLAPPH
ncbi:MAG TPA: DUF4331 family protein [Candidatus Elarobacter sp.]|nr:DUF4331 family protein [Candidatus Elarobacter sp.]